MNGRLRRIAHPLRLAWLRLTRLDQANALAVGALFARLARERGTPVVCATHDPLLIERADAIVRLG